MKLSCKRIGEMGLVARSAISEAMHSKEAVCGERTGDETRTRGRVCIMGEEKIGVKEDTELDTRIMSNLGEGTGGKKITRRKKVEVRGEVEDGTGEVNVGEDSF